MPIGVWPFELGADEYIAKPFSNKEVLETVSRLLSEREGNEPLDR